MGVKKMTYSLLIGINKMEIIPEAKWWMRSYLKPRAAIFSVYISLDG